MKFAFFLSLLFFPTCQPRFAQLSTNTNNEWSAIRDDFIADYEQLAVPGLSIAYTTNLAQIQDLASIDKQEEVFQQLKKSLATVNRDQLNAQEQLEFDLLNYQLSLNEERIALEKKWMSNPPSHLSDKGLATVSYGKEWYRYFLKQWIDSSVTPEQMFDFGMSEVKRVKGRMKDLQERSGMDSLTFQQHIFRPDFFYTNIKTVQTAFDQVKVDLAPKLNQYFPGMTSIPAHRIQASTNEAMAQVPAYYNNNTFYYNYFDKPYNKRQIVWIYLHEAVPGHHYERNYSQTVIQTPLQQLFRVPCYAEGWAAYVEEIGYEIGAYKDIYDELGKWEWDIIRSVRVPLDVGLNYLGWSDEKALAFWQEHIKGQDDIALREIARMKRWPCQVITYKYGGSKIMKWKAHFEKQSNFNLKSFHEKVLGYGPLPISILEGLVMNT